MIDSTRSLSVHLVSVLTRDLFDNQRGQVDKTEVTVVDRSSNDTDQEDRGDRLSGDTYAPLSDDVDDEIQDGVSQSHVLGACLPSKDV